MIIKEGKESESWRKSGAPMLHNGDRVGKKSILSEREENDGNYK
jgi:hypothetical protein